MRRRRGKTSSPLPDIDGIMTAPVICTGAGVFSEASTVGAKSRAATSPYVCVVGDSAAGEELPLDFQSGVSRFQVPVGQERGRGHNQQCRRLRTILREPHECIHSVRQRGFVCV